MPTSEQIRAAAIKWIDANAKKINCQGHKEDRTMYRYRCEKGSTAAARPSFIHCAKLGRFLSVSGERYTAWKTSSTGERYSVQNERVVVRGERGSCRFDGLCWGYSGEGPRGLRDLLLFLGLKPHVADHMAFRSHRGDQLGTDWKLEFPLHRDAPFVIQEPNWCKAWSEASVRLFYHESFVETPPVSLIRRG